ncbi:hypothetical protein H9P43_002448 [Blastocladiella emersonii ATCC 22665]|nr:hypothetical protein H9P43_002448 [Blastocladiella emersonii ATCC 22665]
MKRPARRLSALLALLALAAVLAAPAAAQISTGGGYDDKPVLPQHHEYKHSLRRPFWVTAPNATDTEKVIPHFRAEGGTVPGPAGLTLRLVPAVPRARGLVASTRPLRGAQDGSGVADPAREGGRLDDPTSMLAVSRGWEAVLTMRVTPSPVALAAATGGKIDSNALPGIGMAVWLTSTPIALAAPDARDGVEFGVPKDAYDGLRIAIQPVPSAAFPGRVLISGQVAFQLAGQIVTLGSCTADLRTADSPVTLSIMYVDRDRELSVWVDPSATNKGYTSPCFRRKIELPPRGGYLALSAANGELDRTDDMDVLALDVYALDAPPRPPKTAMSAITYDPAKDGKVDNKTRDHIAEIEALMQKLRAKTDDAALRLAESNAKLNAAMSSSPAAPASPLVPPPTGGAAAATADLSRLESAINRIETQLATLSRAVDSLAAQNRETDRRAESAADRDREWRASLDSRLGLTERALDHRYNEIVALVRQLQGLPESTERLAGHVASVSAKSAESGDGMGWMGMFALMIAAQVAAWCMYAVWRKVRAGKEEKKYL